jgi:hypothetical protein
MGGARPATVGLPRHWRRWTSAGAVAVVWLFFGVRGCRLAGPEEEARVAAMDLFGARMNRRPALEAYEKYHPACFSEHCRGKWSPWRRPDFDKESYVRCLLNKLRVQARLQPLPMPTRSPSPEERARLAPVAIAASATATPTPIETAPPTATPIEGRLFIGDAKVHAFSREPQLRATVQFIALGTVALLPRAQCSYVITCNGELQGTFAGQRMTAPCVTVDGVKGSGRLEVMLAAPAPRLGVCQMELHLTDGEQPRSDGVVVPLG